ncbi:MAG: histidinol-phosphate transaminase [Steroidobacteraceae bacterium]
MNDPLALARAEIRALAAYEHAAWERGHVRLHANELPWRLATDDSLAGLNRYPEPHSEVLARLLARLYDVPPAQVLPCRGSDEAIDLLMRAFCAAGRDAIIVCPPTFGMYAVAARIQGAGVVPVPLLRDRGFALDAGTIADRCARGDVKLVFLCSPNNPTGNALGDGDVSRVVSAAAGRAIVVIDEAYLEFAALGSRSALIAQYPHVVVLRTLSKALGLAGARIGALIAAPCIVDLLRKVLPPYAIAQPCIEAAQRALAPGQRRIALERIASIVRERSRLAAALAALPCVTHVWPSVTNFLLADFTDPGESLARLRRARLLVRDFSGRTGLERALRITVGSPAQNDLLIRSLAC